MSTTTVSTARKPSMLVVALVVPLVAIVAIVVTRAVEGPSSSATAGAATKSGANTIVIKDFAFSPRTLTVAKGTKVTVTNADGTQHTLTAQNGSFDTGVLAGGRSKVLSMNTSGRFAFHCNIHRNMTGTLVVR